jgi:hypothetical protein
MLAPLKIAQHKTSNNVAMGTRCGWKLHAPVFLSPFLSSIHTGTRPGTVVCLQTRANNNHSRITYRGKPSAEQTADGTFFGVRLLRFMHSIVLETTSPSKPRTSSTTLEILRGIVHQCAAGVAAACTGNATANAGDGPVAKHV